jgi:CSLREA domain-containing protein
MKPANAPELLAQKDIDGGLIGGASLEARSFVELVKAAAAVAKTSGGGNMYDNASGGFFNTAGVAQPTDFLGTPAYVVTTTADTWNNADNAESLSLREAVALANSATGAQTVWLPAWNFRLTRSRAAFGGGSPTDTSVAFGDLDVTDSLSVRGVAGRTSVAWRLGVVDKVFELLGDYNNDGVAGGGVNAADYTL